MTRASTTRSFGQALTFGGRIPPSVGLLVVLVVIASIAGEFFPVLVNTAAFVPQRVWGGEVWRLVTWFFFEVSALSLVFAALLLWWFGRDLTSVWGERRFLMVFLGLTMTTAALTLVLDLLPFLSILPGYVGSWAVLTGLMVAWGLVFSDRQILFYLVLPMSGRVLVWVTVGGTLLFALFDRNRGSFVPHFLAQGLAALYVRGQRRGQYRRHFRWNPFERLRRGRRRFSVVEVDQDPDEKPPRWLN